jgi:hypothetical protein
MSNRYYPLAACLLAAWCCLLAAAAAPPTPPRYRDLKILLTDTIRSDSRILFNRPLPERLATLAPILGYDPDSTLKIMRNLILYAQLSAAEKGELQRGGG